MSNAVLAARTATDLLDEFTRSGSQVPFEEVVRRYAGMVYHVCYRVTKNQHDAEDATQAAFLSLAVQCRAGKTVRAVGPWLQKVAHRLALDMRRSAKRRDARENKHIELETHRHNGNGHGPTDRGLNGNHRWDPDELKGLMSEALESLPARYRLPMILHYFGGLDREQIARELKCKVTTLGVRIHRGREMLREQLSGKGITLSVDAIAVLLGTMVRSTVSEELVSVTTSAAKHIAWGAPVDPLGISAHVIGLARSAAKAVLFARIRLAVASVLLVSPMLMAGVGVVRYYAPDVLNQLSPSHLIDRLFKPLWDGWFFVPQMQSSVEEPKTPPVSISRKMAVLVESKSLTAIPSVEPIPVKRPRSNSSSTFSSRKEELLTPTSTPPMVFSWPHYEGASVQTNRGLVSTQSNSNPVPLIKEDKTTVASANEMIVFAAGGGGGPPASHTGSSALSGLDGSFAVADEGYRSNKAVTETLLGGKTGSRAPIVNPATGESFVLAHPDYSPLSANSSDSVNGSVLAYSAYTDARTFRGWGHLNASTVGMLPTQGSIIADGFGQGRTLDFSKVNLVMPNENSPYGGTDGWYAIHKGKLILPSLIAPTGTDAITWGESQTDPSLDLVNSARLTLHNVTIAGSVDISLMSTDNPLIPTLPGGHHFIGVWSYDNTAQQQGPTDLLVRYDSERAFAEGLDEGILKLWVYDQGWHRIMDSTFGRNLHDHQLWGSYNGQITYFAVSAPEPSGLLVLVGTMFMINHRRRQ